MGPHQPAVAARDAERYDACDSHRVRQLDGRSARQEDTASAIDGGALEAGDPDSEAVRIACAARVHDVRTGAGVFPDRSAVLLHTARPDQRGADPLRCEAAEGPGDGRPVL